MPLSTFNTNKTNCIAKIKGIDSESVIREEPMLFGASMRFAYEEGGPLTEAVIDAIISSPGYNGVEKDMSRRGYHPVIDTKSVMLMPGMWPCIPGWHCDGVVRKDAKSQPNLETLNDPVKHYICNIESIPDLCNTEFLVDRAVMFRVDSESVWGSVHKTVEYFLETGQVEAVSIPAGDVVLFNRDELHSGSQAIGRGWRFFFRMSFYHMPCANQIRQQVQVYTDPTYGW